MSEAKGPESAPGGRVTLNWDELWARADSLLEPARLIAGAIDRLAEAARECRAGRPAAAPADPVGLVNGLDHEGIRVRLDDLDREREALMVLLRAARRARKDDPPPPRGKGNANA
jgi:HAMP domain-containing protein